ncbi:SRPBCC domain-containing protein [Novosphingobium aquiterrae]|uniref:SRPBCC domain-containing protein n=1 Tax=Novosphingobium aquiterrae TaxID=624388 RepID=A0ABV6PK15_9SPHN
MSMGETPGAAVPAKTSVERRTDRDVYITRRFAAPLAIVYEAWSRPELFRQWWVPRSAGITLLSCEMDVRTGGTYRLEFGHPQSDTPMAFFGTYQDVVPNSHIAWTNEENPQGSVTTVTFTEEDGLTKVQIHECYPSKEALDEEIASGGAADGMQETLDQLEEFVTAPAKG